MVEGFPLGVEVHQFLLVSLEARGQILIGCFVLCFEIEGCLFEVKAGVNMIGIDIWMSYLLACIVSHCSEIQVRLNPYG